MGVVRPGGANPVLIRAASGMWAENSWHRGSAGRSSAASRDW